MKEILFLTMQDSTPGFALTGVRQQTLKREDVWSTIERACADPDVGVIAADARLLETLDQIRLHELSKRWAGVLVTLPAPADKRTPPSDELQRLVQRALGYHVRLQR